MGDRYCIVLNPFARSGGGSDLQTIVKTTFAGREATVHVPQSLEASRALIREAIAGGVTHVVLAGGDGTVNGVLDLLAGTDVTLGLIPCGTANDLAQQIGVPSDPQRACELILRGERKDLDVIAVNDRFYVTGGALGIATGIAAGVNRWKGKPGLRRSLIRALGSWAYLAYSGIYLMTTPKLWYDVTLTETDGTVSRKRVLVLLINNQAIIGKTFKAAPFARSDDGHLAVCMIEWQGRFRGSWLITLLAANGRHVRHQGVSIWQTRSLTIESDEPIAFMGDGESLAEATTLAISVKPQALRMMAPMDLRRTRHLTMPLTLPRG
jgi:YegS/Rv2252/BmrU family lipid kinase